MLELKQVDEVRYNLVGSIDVLRYESSRTLVNELLNKSSNSALTIDLGELNEVSSVVLSFLLGSLRQAKQVNCRLSFENMSEDLFNMARVGGVEGILLAD